MCGVAMFDKGARKAALGGALAGIPGAIMASRRKPLAASASGNAASALPSLNTAL